MKKYTSILAAALVALLVVSSLAAASQSGAPKPAPEPAPAKPLPKVQLPPGYQAAETISLITGVAISPLLGVGAVGCYQWAQNAGRPEAERRPLNWYASPLFWLPALILVTLVLLKDTLGTAAPTALKKPMDVAEAVENKISGLIAVGSFVPLITQFIPEAAQNSAQLSGMGFATLDLAAVFNTMMVPFAMAAFAVVWLASHAINMLILISPFSTVDMALKSFRMFLLSLVATTHWINPYFGALFALVLIFVSYFIAGWSFRLLVTGSVFIWDFATLRRRRFTPAVNGNWMFTTGKIEKVPVRTYGRLLVDNSDKLRFEYRPWLFLAKKSVELPAGQYFVGRGLFYPEILMDAPNDEPRSLFFLPPRYCAHEEDLRRACQFKEVRDIGLLKGLKAFWSWLRRLFGVREDLPAASGVG